MKRVDIKLVDIDVLVPNPRNPRLIQEAIEPVARSIHEFGFLVPIVINEENVVLSGHARLAAAKTLELEKVPTIRAEGLSEDQQKAFMLADNRLSENASYNNEELAKILKELTDSDYDASLTGFQAEEIAAFISTATDSLDDILGLSDDDESSEGGGLGDLDSAEEDTRHMHRMVFVLTTEQKDKIMDTIEKMKDTLGGNPTNGEALVSICEELSP